MYCCSTCLNLNQLQVNPAFLEEMKRGIEMLPLETNAVTSVGAHLGALDAPAFAALLKDLARDNHAFRYDHYLALRLLQSIKFHRLHLRLLCDSMNRAVPS